MAKLTDSQRTLLDKYLEEKYQLIRERNPNTSEVCSWCREALKFDIDIGNLTTRVGPAGKLFTHIWPQTEQTRKGRLTDRLKQNLIIEQLELIRSDLARLATEMGSAGYGRQMPEWKEIIDAARSDVADTDRREPEEK